MKKIYYTTKSLFNLAKIAIRPSNTEAGLSLTESLLALGLLEDEVKKCQETAADREVVRTRHQILIPDLLQLRALPEGTFGREFADHMIRENLQPDFFKVLEIKNDETFIMMRLRQAHDLWHVLTGFTTSVPDELGLLTFMMAQTHSPLTALLVGGRLMVSAFKNPAETREIFNSVAKGWIMGQRARSVFGLDWENHWTTPLNDLRRQYQIAA